MNFNSFIDAFIYLNSLKRRITIVIDEYPYLKYMTAGEAVDSVFQNVIDNHITNLNLILSGSHTGMMKDMLEEGHALYGRFGTVIALPELSYREAASFYPEKSIYEKAAFYSVFGGSPYILGQLDPKASLEENMENTILNENSAAFLYASNILLSDYSNQMNIERLFAVLGNGKKKYRDIEDRLDANKTGNLSKQLKSLIKLDIVRRQTPINRQEDSKKATYEINDNLLRFYFTYVYRNRSALQMLGPTAFAGAYVRETLPTFISYRFEEICRLWFSGRARAGELDGVKNIGSYYYDDPVSRTNGAFDIALDYGDAYTIIEAKYLKGVMSKALMHHEAGQIREIKGLTVKDIGFISINGFEEREEGYLYFDGEDLYGSR